MGLGALGPDNQLIFDYLNGDILVRINPGQFGSNHH
jgi:hypothetical protein